MENTNLEIDEKSNQETKPVKEKSWKSDVLEIVESTFITVFVIVLIFTYLLHPVNVVGHSMVPTLNDGDRIFMSTITNISCGDIVVINNDAAYLFDDNGEVYEASSGSLNECIIKRAIACGGQTVDIDFDTWEITVDGEALDEEYINSEAFEAGYTLNNDGAFDYPFTVPEGYYFVMGDNRNNSSDSRNPRVGLIKDDQIYGKAVIKYSPEIEIL
ncbi:MAG: signal peptidase I [Ruminococcus sp.]|nr:signal peptidase I [Ruminococcus sp.]